MSSEPALHPDLESLRQQFAAIRTDAENLLRGLTNEQFNWRPEPGKWSIAECIAHLNLADGLDLAAIDAAISQARRDGIVGNGPFRYGAVSSWFIRRIEPPPSSMKAKAPKVYAPAERADLALATGEFRRIQARLAELVVAADGVDLARVKVPTPFSKWIKFSLGQRFRLIAAHDRRHLYQAWGVRRTLP
jgi:hypothetical protein